MNETPTEPKPETADLMLTDIATGKECLQRTGERTEIEAAAKALKDRGHDAWVRYPKPTPPPEAVRETPRTEIPTNYPWLETAHFLPDSTETMLLAWVRGEHVTYRTGRYLGGKFIGTSRDEFRTQPNYFREVTGLFNLPDEGDKLRAENAALTSKLAELTKERDASMEILDTVARGFERCLSRVLVDDKIGAERELKLAIAHVDNPHGYTGSSMAGLRSALIAKTLEADGLRKYQKSLAQELAVTAGFIIGGLEGMKTQVPTHLVKYCEEGQRKGQRLSRIAQELGGHSAALSPTADAEKL